MEIPVSISKTGNCRFIIQNNVPIMTVETEGEIINIEGVCELLAKEFAHSEAKLRVLAPKERGANWWEQVLKTLAPWTK